MRVLAGFWRPLSFYFGFDCKFAVLSSRLKQVAVHENGMKYVYQGPDVYQTEDEKKCLWLLLGHRWEFFFLVRFRNFCGNSIPRSSLLSDHGAN